MTKFSFTKDQFKKIQTHANLVSDILKNDNVDTYFIVDNNNVDIYHYGPGVIINTSVDIKDCSQASYFVVPFDKFMAGLSKAFENTDETTVEYSDDNIFTFKNDKMKLTLKGFKVVDEMTIKEVGNAYTSKSSAMTDVETVNVNDDLIKFSSLVSKYMALTSDSNAITVNNTSLKYLDRMIIADKKVCNITSSTEPLYITKNLFGFIEKLYKTCSDASFKINKKSDMISFDNGIIKGVLAQNNISLAMPTDEEIAEALPEENAVNKVVVKRCNLIDTFKSFEGIFDNSRKMGKTYVKSSDELLTEGVILFTYADVFNKVETKLPVIVNTNYAANIEFILSLNLLIDAADIIGNSEDINIDYNNIDIGEPHGSGIKIYDNEGNTVYIMKFFE